MSIFTNKSTIERINLDGELGIVNSARISFNNWKNELDAKDLKLIKYLKDHNHKSPFFHPQIICLFADREDVNELLLSEYDKDLFAGIEICGEYVRFSMYSYELVKDKLPSHAIISNPNNEELNELIAEYGLKKATTIPYLSFRISCPFLVHTQLDRHRIGLAINMVSRRYVDTPPQFWKPKKWRKQSENNKQASIENEFVKERSAKFTSVGLNSFTTTLYDYENSIEIDNRWYRTNLENKMCKEMARAKLPLATFTSFVWTGSLEDYARIYKERTSPLAQIETKEVAIEIGKICEKEYPDAWKQLTFKKD
jgi:flavin-dependent thymidylate synthase